MANKVFDKETILDLTVNFIPLFIILFFVVGYAVFTPFGTDPMATGIQYAIMICPFVFLAILTYLSAELISTAEHTNEHPPGQANIPTATLEREGETSTINQ